jgi:hypothetical protein
MYFIDSALGLPITVTPARYPLGSGAGLRLAARA